jgi:4-hydroxybenzoate polyprenyltransferase
MNLVKKYASLVKFSHTIFALPFAIIGFFIGLNPAIFSPNNPINATVNSSLFFLDVIKLFSFVLLCMVFARSAAMAFNRYLDSSFDAKNPRTAIREIPAGIISKQSALRFVIINSLLFVIVTFL